MMDIKEEIAIVGIGCNFPGGEGVDNFWRVLVEGRNCTVEIPPERFDTKEWYDPDPRKPGKTDTKHAALIEGLNAFDNKLFGINDIEAEHMDPQQKLLLECSYRALEDAGIPREKISGSKTGVFVGLMNEDFRLLSNKNAADISHYTSTGTAMSIAANRISYTFNLTGPSLAMDTACSSFNYALHFALHAIRQGDCESALCAGVSCILDPQVFVSLRKARMISPEGTSKPFSMKADGYGRGEGCGVLLLKSLKKAQEDFNRIWGVINISTVNQNGRSVTPITRPSQQEQEKLLLSVYPTHVDPSMVQYVEAHGTGTPAGDPTEAESLGNVIGKRRSPNMPPLKIGSVKGNIGHTESAAGAASLIKVLLMMHHGKIVPTLHFSEGNSSIDAKELNLSIPTRVEDWEDSSEFGRVAGINSFGFGGTNAHVVVRQVKSNCVLPPVKRPAEIFAISAASGKSLQLAMKDTSRYLSTGNTATLPSLAYTSACRRSHLSLKHRKAFVVSSLQQLQQQLLSAAGKETAPSRKAPQLIFVFSGNGLNMKGIFGASLRSEPVFRAKWKEVEGLFQQFLPNGFLNLTENEGKDLSRPDIAQPLLFTLQVAMVALLQHWGFKPIAALGHSVGEVAAAHCAGLLSLEDAVKVIYHRSRLQAKVSGGKMLVVGNIPVPEVSSALAAYSGKVCIAAFNSPVSCTVSGDPESIEALQKDLAERFGQRNIFLQPLNVPAAYHSHMMDPVLTEMAASLSELKKGKSEMDLISTATGKAVSGGDFVTGSYWARQARDPVSFVKAIMTSAKNKENPVFIEIGPQRALKRYIMEILGRDTKVFPSLHLDREYETLFELVKELFELGFNPDWEHLYEEYHSPPAAYPRYQFDHKEAMPFGIMKPSQSLANLKHLLIPSVNSDGTQFKYSISQSVTPYLFEHKHNGVALLPGAFFAELALATAMTAAGPKELLSSHQLSIAFKSPCVLGESTHDLNVKLECPQPTRDFQILSSSGAVYAMGQIIRDPTICLEEKNISYKDIFERCKSSVSRNEIYETLGHYGFEFGSALRQLDDVFYCEGLKEAIATIKVNEDVREEMHDYFIHPALLDCFLQMTVVMVTKNMEKQAGFPSNISSFVMVRPLEEEMMIYIKTSTAVENYVEYCGCFTDKNGSVLAELKGVGITFMITPSSEASFLLENKWKEVIVSQTMETSVKVPKVAVFADEIGISQQLQKYLHKDSKFLMYEDWEKLLESRSPESTALNSIKREIEGYSEVLFMWGIRRLNEEDPDSVVASLSKCCEALRQLIVALRAKTSHGTIKIITYRTTDRNVDHVNPGFALCGMTRSCITEATELTFQLIDVSSTRGVDISTLVSVLVGYKPEEYPEISITKGRIYTSEIRRTQTSDESYKYLSNLLETPETMCTLYNSESHKIKEVFAELSDHTGTPLDKGSVEIQVDKIALHSEDYYPLTVTSFDFGNTLYWQSQIVDKHKLLALDCSGTVVATGCQVRNIKVGDHVALCYPVSASSRIRIPEAMCFKTKKFQCFETAPCMSFFRVAWEIFHQMLPKQKQNGTVGIISTEPGSVLCRVLALAAEEVGWKTFCASLESSLEEGAAKCSTLVFIPPLERLPKDICARLPYLRDVVIMCDTHHSKHFRTVIGSGLENTEVHFLSLATIFQKTYLERSHKAFSSWLKSMQQKKFKNLPCSVFQQAGNSDSTNAPKFSKFTCKSMPIAVLKSNKDSSGMSDIVVYEMEKKLFKENAVYIVTGGLTGLGFETVRFIAENGGGCIVILSRRKPTAEMQKEISNLQNQNKGSKVVSLQCNVISRLNVEAAINSISKIFPKCPIKGVFHSAVVFHDANIEALTLSTFEEVLNPKVAGVLNLHQATKGHDLDYFVCYSSISSFLGNSTQANYAASNSFLDFFCHYRRNCGLPGQSLNWGALNLGFLQNQGQLQNLLKMKGISTLQVNDIFRLLRTSLILNNPQQVLARLNFRTLVTHHNSRIPALRSRMLSIMAELFGSTIEFSEQAVSQDMAPIKSEDYILSLLSQLTGTDPHDIAMNTPLSAIGLDSMLAMTLHAQIFHEQKLDIPLVHFLDPHTTVLTLTGLLEEGSKVLKESEVKL